jgi:O-antigen ligase
MTKKSSRRLPAERPRANSLWTWRLAVAAVITVPVTMSLNGTEAFRTPKLLLLTAFSICIAVAGVAVWLRGRRQAGEPIALRTVPLFAGVAVAWTAVSTLVSTNRALSLETLVWVTAVAVFAIAVDLGGRTRGTLSMAWPLLPASINALIFLLQRFHVWNPIAFTNDVPDHFRYTALVGNPDDVGGLLVAPAVVAVALVIIDRARRFVWGPAAALLLVALATGRLTSMAASGAALLTMGFLRSRRGGLIAAALLLVSGIALVAGYRPMRERATAIIAALRIHDYSEATSGRVTPFLTAAMMAKDHPIFGVGPGCFRWEYFDYKLSAESKHPSLAKTWGADFNFGETHNDHLQTLAETGIPGYAILAAAFLVVAGSSRRRPGKESEEDPLIRTVSMPLSVGIGVLCLGHFPLHLAASTTIIVYIGALCVSRGAYAEIGAPAAVRARLNLFRPRFVPAPLALALGILAGAAGAILAWQIAWLPWQCNEMKKRLEARTGATYDAAADTLRTAERARQNLAELQACREATPTDVGVYMLIAANDRLIGRMSDAVMMYRTALQYDRRPELYYNLGLTELEMRQRGPAVADLIIAVRFSRKYLAELPSDVQSEINEALRRQFPYLVGT